jgi:hypothetical protein
MKSETDCPIRRIVRPELEEAPNAANVRTAAEAGQATAAQREPTCYQRKVFAKQAQRSPFPSQELRAQMELGQ